MDNQQTQRPAPESTLMAGQMKVEVFADRNQLGCASGLDAAALMRQIIASKGRVVAVFAAAPSQNEFLETLRQQPGIDWSKVVAFHLDEYVGLPETSPASFRYYLKSHIFDYVHPGVMNLIGGDAPDPAAEAERYSALLRENKIDMSFIGIGENGHLAFNDPPVADFNDPKLIKIVELEERCRVQQVHDGCFPALNDVPKTAFSMTIPELMSADALFTMVPTKLKAEAVKATINGPISTDCPASILRTHPNCKLYLDKDSASLL
jgi:glucosamine-6-phosphate deaminase